MVRCLQTDTRTATVTGTCSTTLASWSMDHSGSYPTPISDIKEDIRNMGEPGSKSHSYRVFLGLRQS